MNEMIKPWKEKGIARGEFEFSCGGDSMNETQLNFYDENDNLVECSDLESYFNDAVYREIDFYEASDGHYMGESGKVHINLNDEEDDFEYVKSSTSEWSERYHAKVNVPLTKEENELFEKYVANMRYVHWDGFNVDYKRDFILTDEIESRINALHTKLLGYAEQMPYEGEGDVNEDSYQYSTADLDEEVPTAEFVEIEGVRNLVLHTEIEVYEYREDD
jgi:hypothetical protein